jgi:uncharacterized protein YndB with AHSA1/START domain
MDKPKFVYVSYISSTPEKVWNALTYPEVTRKYWGNHHNASDWKVGSRWEHRDFDDPKLVDIVGTVVESDYPRRLAVTWVRPKEEGDAQARTSKVTYEIEDFMGVVRLTVTHDELDQEMYDSVSIGWPAVISALKTLLETGSISAAAGRRPANCG